MNKFTDAEIHQQIFDHMKKYFKFKRVLENRNKGRGVRTIHRLNKFVYVNGGLQGCLENTFAETYDEIQDMFSHCKSEVTLFLGC